MTAGTASWGVTLLRLMVGVIYVVHGYVGYAPLPPGIRKNLARGKPLPPGIAKKMVPGPMLRDLPVYAGHEWRVAGDDLILVSLGSGLVVEVMGDIFR